MKKQMHALLAAFFPLFVVMCFCATAAHAEPPGIDLSNWNRTLSVDSKGTVSGEAVEIKAAGSFPPGLPLVFNAPVGGAHTSGSKYPRDELREMKGAAKAAWSLATGGTMTATLTVDKAPFLKDGAAGKEVIGQIHGKEDELVRLYWDAGRVYFHNDLSGSDGKEHEFKLLNAAGKEPSVTLGEKISYLIDAHADRLMVELWAHGDHFSYSGKILPVWQKDNGLYFKAGVYDGANASQGATGAGQTSFYALDFGHTAGGGMRGMPPPPEPAAAPLPKRSAAEIAGDLQKLADELRAQ